LNDIDYEDEHDPKKRHNSQGLMKGTRPLQ